MTNVLVVGGNGFIGRHLNNIFTFDRIAYRDLYLRNLRDYDVVVNCALNPHFKTSPYTESIDVDFEVGRMACEAGCHYVMLSTSKVYGQSERLTTYNEFSPVNPFDYYGENKLSA